MKKYGLILADMGCNMNTSVAPVDRWNNDELQQWAKLEVASFEVVKFNKLCSHPN